MKTDTTLFEIFSDLGILELMQTEEGNSFIEEETETVWDNTLVAA